MYKDRNENYSFMKKRLRKNRLLDNKVFAERAAQQRTHEHYLQYLNYYGPRYVEDWVPIPESATMQQVFLYYITAAPVTTHSHVCNDNVIREYWQKVMDYRRQSDNDGDLFDPNATISLPASEPVLEKEINAEQAKIPTAPWLLAATIGGVSLIAFMLYVNFRL